MQNLSCIDDMTSVPARERPASILLLPFVRDTRVRVRGFCYREFRAWQCVLSLAQPQQRSSELYSGHLLCRKSATSSTYRGSALSVPRLYVRLILPAVLCTQATSSCSKPVRLEWERQRGPREMVPWSQTSSEDAARNLGHTVPM